MHNIALLTILFDYPEQSMPIFYSNAIKFFHITDIHIARYNNLIKTDCYYTKLAFYKIYKLLEYIKEFISNKYEYILFCDATDTNFYKDPTNIIDDFMTFNCNILFCAEKCFWPPINEKHLYDNKPKLSDAHYLNSGLYMGYTHKIIEHLEEIIKNNRTSYDDQGHWTLEYLLNNDIQIDQLNRIFFSTLESKSDISVINNKYIIKSNPYIIHDNGPHGNNTLKLSDKL